MMHSSKQANDNMRSLFINIVVVLMVLIMMSVALRYFYHREPDVKRMALGAVADNFATSVMNAHWQWQAEGRPVRVLLVKMDEQGHETSRSPVPMSHLGWPRTEPDKNGCEKIWQALLGQPLVIRDFNVNADYYDGVKNSGNALDSMCRYKLPTGPYFDYFIYTGKVKKTNV